MLDEELASQRLLKEPEAAKRLSIGHSSLKGLRLRGEGPRYIQLSERRLAYRPSDLDAWLERTKPPAKFPAVKKQDVPESAPVLDAGWDSD